MSQLCVAVLSNLKAGANVSGAVAVIAASKLQVLQKN
jgi:hypothetical protein